MRAAGAGGGEEAGGTTLVQHPGNRDLGMAAPASLPPAAVAAIRSMGRMRIMGSGQVNRRPGDRVSRTALTLVQHRHEVGGGTCNLDAASVPAKETKARGSQFNRAKWETGETPEFDALMNICNKK